MQQISIEGNIRWQGDPQKIVQKIAVDHTNKWYVHNPASVLEKETQKLLWDFEIQTDRQISARWPDFIIINKREKTCRIMYFAQPVDCRVKLKESKKRDKYLDLARESKKNPVEH